MVTVKSVNKDAKNTTMMFTLNFEYNAYEGNEKQLKRTKDHKTQQRTWNIEQYEAKINSGKGY